MREFKCFYDFYKLPEGERKALIGKAFRQEGRETTFFPVGLTDPESNYGVAQGLIFVLPVMTSRQGDKWFRVGVASPDDIDMDLDFKNEECGIRQDVIQFLTDLDLDRVTYDSVLELIRDHFGAGKFT